MARPSNPPQPAATTPADLLATADDITRQVVALRGLKLLRPVAKGVLDRQAIATRLRERIEKEYSPDELLLEERVLKRLGLLPEDVDYPKLVNDLLMEQVAGFYDPFASQLYLADWLSADVQRPALAHELEHALQDQHFDLKRFVKPLKDNSDRQLAHAALIEGDGMALMLEFVAQGLSADLTRLPETMEMLVEQLGQTAFTAQTAAGTQLGTAPRFVRESLIFPYFGGLRFITALRKETKGSEKRWASINDVFQRPPESTEQVMHPGKYLTEEHPVQVVGAPLALLGLGKALHEDVMGEFGWYQLLASQLGDAESRYAAAGWGGDRMAVYGAATQGPVTLVALSTWDSDRDAQEFERALGLWMAKRLKQPEPEADQAARFTVGAETWLVERRGQAVLTLIGVAEPRSAAVREAVWRTWQIGARTGP